MVHVAAATLLLGALRLPVASAESLPVVNPNFSTVAVECSGGWAYQSDPGGTCESEFPEQDFNTEVGIGWTFAPWHEALVGTGVTGPNTGFDPPPFTGLPFDTAALLQEQSVIFQEIPGFVLGQTYKLTFYLGSRYNSGVSDGNQTVLVKLDEKPIGFWKLVSFTPFTLRTVLFTADSAGPQVLEFLGTIHGDHTAFFSGVSIVSVSGQ
jgi:hypothetical protein